MRKKLFGGRKREIEVENTFLEKWFFLCSHGNNSGMPGWGVIRRENKKEGSSLNLAACLMPWLMILCRLRVRKEKLRQKLCSLLGHYLTAHNTSLCANLFFGSLYVVSRVFLLKEMHPLVLWSPWFSNQNHLTSWVEIFLALRLLFALCSTTNSTQSGWLEYEIQLIRFSG